MFKKNSCREESHTVCSVTFFFENLTVYEIMWKNTVEPGKPQMTIWRMRIASWVHKATSTYSEYVILTDFPLQQWLHERASALRYAYISCFVCSYVEILHLVCPVIRVFIYVVLSDFT
jgi:hypothetical protein